MQSTPFCSTQVSIIFSPPCYLQLGLTSDLLPSGFTTTVLYSYISCPTPPTYPANFIIVITAKKSDHESLHNVNFFQLPVPSAAYVMLNVVPLVWKNEVTRPYKIRNKISFVIYILGSNFLKRQIERTRTTNRIVARISEFNLLLIYSWI
jgi:hypothetical protein